MTLTVGPNAPSTAAPARTGWPAEVDLIISAMAAGEDRASAAVPGVTPGVTHRQHPRMSYRVIAALRLFSDQHDAPPWQLFTRDVGPRGLGFVTSHRLPLGYGGTVELPTPDGQIIEVPCTLLRCREIASGWFDGGLYFNREQAVFTAR